MPKYYQDFNVIEDFKKLNSQTVRAILPKMTEDHNRVILLKLTGHEFSHNIIEDMNCLAITYAEYLYSHDYIDGFIFIVDYTEADLFDLSTKINLIQLRHSTAILLEAFGVRVKAIHLVSTSKVVETLIKIFRQVVSEKVANRIEWHKDIESLRDRIPDDILPIEYGGKGKSYKVVHDEWLDLLSSEKVRAFYRDTLEARTDENRRQKQDFHNQYLGMPESATTERPSHVRMPAVRINRPALYTRASREKK
ncbi:uncharacterized protein LOC126377389 isoform X2 [Pectinophora gossypiella]|nr:uncharacterized protein LOC126377389 isoform X2 [Pectinophora gossypiella]